MNEKRLGILLVMLLLAALMAFNQPSIAVAIDNQINTIIYPTGIYPQDLQNVQAAVDQGGAILLKAVDTNGVPTAFNFGDLGYAILTQDVDIMGETVDGTMTTIQGGWDSLVSVASIDFSVQGIRFDGALSSAILVLEARRTEIVGNEIVNVVGLTLPFLPEIRKGQGIWVANGGSREISGEMVIADNIIANVDAELGYGIAIVGTAATTTITDNDFRGFNTAGIRVAAYTNPVLIEQNFVAPGPERFATFTSAGNGIWVTNLFTQSGAPVTVSQNRVICDNPWADGIVAAGYTTNVNIAHNHVTMNDSIFGGITLGVGSSESFVGQNRIDGSASYGLSIANFGLFPGLANRSNMLVGNNISQIDATVADVYFGPEVVNNTLIGNSWTVIDEGENNQITGFEPIDGNPGIGNSISEAQARKLDDLHHVEAEAAAAITSP